MVQEQRDLFLYGTNFRYSIITIDGTISNDASWL